MTDRVDDPDGCVIRPGTHYFFRVLVRNMSFKFRENWNYILGHMEILAQAVRRPINNSFLVRRDIARAVFGKPLFSFLGKENQVGLRWLQVEMPPSDPQQVCRYHKFLRLTFF